MSRKKNKKKKKHPNRRTRLNGPNVDLDLIFCTIAKKYRLEKTLIKAMAITESALDVRAYRHEPMFWERYLKNNDAWKDKESKIVSASWGLFQIMWTTAHQLGFRGTKEELCNPVINTELACKLLRQLMDRTRSTTNEAFWPLDVAICRYNGGSRGNPRSDGTLRNQSYLDKVKTTYWKLRAKREECE